MGDFSIQQGRDIKLKGAVSDPKVVLARFPSKVAIHAPDFKGLKFRLAVAEGDAVKAGSPILTDKNNPDLKLLSPVSGKVLAVHRGEKRVLLDVIIEADRRQDAVALEKCSSSEVQGLPREKVVSMLLAGGLWPAIRQRPFSKVADPKEKPKSLFVQAMNTEPLALNLEPVLDGREDDFQTGLDILRKLTDGAVHLCFSAKASLSALVNAKNVEKHRFSGPHPAGNVSTHIHYVDPINKGDIVWYITAQDVLRIAELFLKGIYPSEKIVAVTGEGADKARYVKAVQGASVESLVEETKDGMRYISGNVLRGTDVGRDGFLCFYDSQITALPRGGRRALLGWLSPGVDKYSFSKTFVSSFLPEHEASLDTDKQGSDRAIVLTHVYDPLVPLDIMVNFLIRAVIGGDIEEAERLGILECDEEDFALCSFACPSKTDVGEIIRSGLDLIEKEG